MNSVFKVPVITLMRQISLSHVSRPRAGQGPTRILRLIKHVCLNFGCASHPRIHLHNVNDGRKVGDIVIADRQSQYSQVVNLTSATAC